LPRERLCRGRLGGRILVEHEPADPGQVLGLAGQQEWKLLSLHRGRTSLAPAVTAVGCRSGTVW